MWNLDLYPCLVELVILWAHQLLRLHLRVTMPSSGTVLLCLNREIKLIYETHSILKETNRLVVL